MRLDLAPDQSRYNAADERLRDAAGKLQLALNAEDVKVLPCHACRAGHSSCFAAPTCYAIADSVPAYNLVGLRTEDGVHLPMRQLALTACKHACFGTHVDVIPVFMDTPCRRKSVCGPS